MPRVERGRRTSEKPERVNRPGEETGRSDHPPESVVEHVVIAEGPQGDPGNDGAPSTVPGPQGPQGVPGQPGDPGVVSYRHVQSQALAVWTVVHNLHYRPGGIYVENSDHEQVFPRVTHVDSDTLLLSFFAAGAPAAMGGEAELS